MVAAPAPAQAGILGALNSLLALFQPQQILQVGQALNTGQMQQMQGQQQQLNQVLQEQSQTGKEIAAANAQQQYLSQTNNVSELPAVCTQSKAAAGFLQSANAANVQGADSGAALGTEGGVGVVAGKTNLPTQQAKLNAISGYTPTQTDAQALFEGKRSGDALPVEGMLLNPISSAPITLAQAKTPAGIVWNATHNSAEAGLSLASEAMGFVSGLHALSVPGSAVAAVSSAAGVSASHGASTTSSITAVGTRAPSTPSPPVQTGNWRALVPQYANQVAAAAKAENLSPAIIAATIAHEDGSENLKAMPCGNPTSYTFGGASSLFCTKADSSAKSLGQMIDSTATGLGSSYGLTNPMVTYGQNPNIELKAMASGLKNFLSQCNGNVACTLGAWNYGSVTPGMVNNVWPNAATQTYVTQGMAFYTGQKNIPVGSYQGGGAGASGSESPASSAGLLRLVSLGSYANPAFYQKLQMSPPAGVWRTIAYLESMSLNVANQNRELLERLSGLMAARLSLAEQGNIHGENLGRANAIAQSNGAMSGQ
jgi:hypothetical protein